MSTETKVGHTPGPWYADWDDNGWWYIEPLGITGTYLRGDSDNCVEAANARLIAAAPELLEALIVTVKALRGPSTEIDRSAAARLGDEIIGKATGTIKIASWFKDRHTPAEAPNA